ncbi:hypothetical protein DFA_06642 [Cavenderia fasciculata]|uniref:Nucleotidyltransferase n=1 Tax=Cavenderia fasciculata TaxID=261658 RepID=F4Q1V6_CACFS|nr:uncharacterized protein DFA_06642 [Cavenderia fasciculata]EGG17976.1 hypothetical protein DFA_06642 [Cavenderia fasciculata]|eukprot:XP_004356868.1 hypothetical protein DFA_06642 [Cavenderia fasciculata]
MENTNNNNSQHFKKLGEDLLKEKKVKAQLLFFCQVGSHSFNLNVETSDNDYFGVYELDADQLLSLTLSPHAALIDGHQPEDFVLYELSKFCELLLKGNPKLVEPLFTERNCYISQKWEQLRSIRHSFISQLVISHYVSYSKSQLGDAKKAQNEKTSRVTTPSSSSPTSSSSSSSTSTFTPSKGSTEERKEKNNDGLSNNHSPSKKLYHTIRLLHETVRMLNGDDPLVYLQGQHRDYIMNIRMGKISVQESMDQVNNLYEQVYKSIDEMKSTNPHNIPMVGDKMALNNWIINCRRSTINQFKSSTTTTSSEYYNEDQLKLVGFDKQFETVIDKCNEIMVNNNITDYNILYVGRSGSTLHGVKKNDQDWIAVYATKTDTQFSLYQPIDRLDITSSPTTNNTDASSTTRDTYVTGIQLFEVSYFLNLLSQGNHRAVEQFYNEKVDYCSSQVWDDLRLKNINYLTANFIQHCWGVAQGQIAKSKSLLSSNKNNDNDNEDIFNCIRKHCYHASRLLYLTESVLKNNTLEIKPNESERDKLIAILETKLNFDSLDKLIQETSSQSNLINLQTTKLGSSSKEKKAQETNVKSSVNNWIVKLRLSL